MDNVKLFSEKYDTASKIGQKLIDGFYKDLNELYKKTNQNSKILEVACGPGVSTKWISEWVPEGGLYASDVEDDLVAEAQIKNPTVPVIKESIYELSRADEEFNVVFALEVLEHLENPQKAIDEIYRVTNKYAIISVPREPVWRILNISRGKYLGDLGNTPGHINHWGRGGFQKILSTKFNIIDSRSPLPWQMYLLQK